MRKSTLVIMALAVLACSGCATAGRRQAGVELGARMAGKDMTLSWPSRRGTEYTVLYSESMQAPVWKPLAGHVNLQGTGREMQAVDAGIPSGTRFYRLHVGHYGDTGPSAD